MLVLDENIRDSQAEVLRKFGITNRKIGADLASKGTSDANIVPLLLRLKQPTFFTHDADFGMSGYVTPVTASFISA